MQESGDRDGSPAISIAAVVATHDRPRLLANRALASIARQSRPPDLLVVVDDSSTKVRGANEQIVADFRADGTQTVYLENHRTPGAAGAWNTALAWLQGNCPSTFVAVLDDDDAWDPAYLERCEAAAKDGGLDMAAAGIVYHGSSGREGQPLTIPQNLDVDDLLVRNPHVQGSNLFIRLRKVLEAGAFDEGLASTTDRDLCIRLADLGSVRYGAVPQHLVHHYAEDDRPRLSTPGGAAKCAGLRAFYRKHASRMTTAQRTAFIERSRTAFGCDPVTDEPDLVPALTPMDAAIHSPSAEAPLQLVVGAITSPDTDNIARLLDALSRKVANAPGVTMKVVLLENGRHDAASRAALRSVVEDAARRGVDVEVKSLEKQAADVEEGIFAVGPGRLSERKSIALARTMLQHYLFLEAKPRQGPVVWILDDDIALEGLAYSPDGAAAVVDVDYVSAIRCLKETGACVVLSEVTGDPPLPFLSCIRTQLVDLHYNLQQLSALKPDTPYPDQRGENRRMRMGRRDYYYDLSRTETDHLETPFWYEPSEDGLRAGQVFGEMTTRLPAMLSGVQLFRPLTQTGAFDLTTGLIPSVHRGPSTLVFDVQALREFPNTVPTIGGSDARRSDMVWSLLNRFVGGCRIVQAPLPVRQVRRADANAAPDFQTLAQDILGYAVYSALHDVLLRKAQERQRLGQPPYGRRLLRLDDSDIEQAVRLYTKYVRERSRAFELSFLRVMGLVSALKRFYGGVPGAPATWWLQSAEHQESVVRLRDFVETLESIYTDAQLDDFRQSLAEGASAPIAEFLRGLPEVVARHRSNTPLPVDSLRSAAEAYVRAEFATGPLTCLGIGEEGVVLTDGRSVYKYFHYWKATNGERGIAFLQSLAGKLSGYTALPDLQAVHRRGDHVVAVYPYEAGTRYEGGRLDQVLTLLRECRDAGLVCRNVQPDNLLVADSGLKLIDLGSDLVPFSERGFDQMCRRAFLSYRFPFRTDLKELMTRALTDESLAELTGFEQFVRALDPHGLEDLYFQPLTQLVLERRPASALDYGSGSGWLAERLSRAGVEAAAYDPDPARVEEYSERGGAVRYGGAELLGALLARRARFDAVVCSRVLCTIEGGAEFNGILRDLRRLVADSGTVTVVVCNPFHLSTVSTKLAVKQLPADFDYRAVFTYAKSVAPSGNVRSETHRSFACYKQAFANAGLLIEEAIELEGADTQALLPASDHLAFRLRPAPGIAPEVSLLIKTCLMEWRIIERLVRHQVGQLEGPGVFAEKVVVVDPSEGPFTRQYEAPNAEAHRAAMERLLQDGVVQRVVYAPQEPAAIRDAYRKWFGAESEETHSANGQQLFATLYGFDSCKSDYVLQLDSDLLIARADRTHDYLSEMAEVLRGDPQTLFVPLSIYGSEALPYTAEGPKGGWRVEARGCMFDRRRLQEALPVENPLQGGRFTMAWHRAFDRAAASKGYRSYRGGDPRTAFIHTPNERKSGVAGLFEVIGAVERGYVPECQLGQVELTGSVAEWAGPRRTEPFVFVICGRNVEPGRFKRCVESLVAQSAGDWGAVVVDDASTNGFGDYAAMLLAEYADRVTLIRNETQRGSLYNTWNAIARFCADPESVIITLDADDALAGPHILERVRTEYGAGADLTVGSMVRLDKEAAYPVDFDAPRMRGSNVWQHLRTFKKCLFDAIDVEDLKLDGEWIGLAGDWAYMVPMVEMASNPRRIEEPLYVYEPASPKQPADRRRRDAIIARILAKPGYARLRR